MTFLLTDVDVSTAPALLAAHRGVRLPRGANGGTAAAFASAADAVAAALHLQRTCAPDNGSGYGPRGRIGIHTGEARPANVRSYAQSVLQRGARLRDVAHAGQTLLTAVTASIVGDAVPGGAWLRDLGCHRLRDLSAPERIFELRHAELPDDFPPLRSLDELANNLPPQLTSFVGCSQELAAVERLLGTERMVTLTGSGGCGKTRLAVQAAARLADRWPDGVWWVDLGPVTDPALVAELAAAATKVMVEPVGGPVRALTVHRRDRRLLVCLDNCEHLLDAGAELADALLRSCPEVSVLATTREPLGVAGETVWRSLPWSRRRPSRCSPTGAATCVPDSPSTPTTSRPFAPCASGSTAFPWPSSSLLPGSALCPPPRSPTASTTGSDSLPAAPGA